MIDIKHPTKIGDGDPGSKADRIQGPRKVGVPGRFEGATIFGAHWLPWI